MNLADFTQACCQRVDNELHQHTQAYPGAERLLEAMRYSLFNGGKRMRPLLSYATAEALGLAATQIDSLAAAIECIHAYSLIHDDLPAMDDDDLRRGKPTCHIAFDEATAILAGDALNTLAFQILASSNRYSDNIKIKLIQQLSQAAGAQGMVAGQMMDIAATAQSIELAELERLHQHKTGALLRASILMAATAAQANETQLQQLDSYAQAIGLAFQIKDDVLDIEGDTATLGKPQGSDLALAKSTFPALLGLQACHQRLAQLEKQALTALEDWGTAAERLRQLARYIIQRHY